jgi:hypothetical protein
VSHRRSETVQESEFSTVRSRSVTDTRAWSATGRYSFSAPKGVTFLGKKIRFRSDLTLNLDLDRNEDKTRELEIRTGGVQNSTVRSHRKSLNVTPRATYNFSRKVQGSLDLRYTKTKDLRLDRTETVVGLAVEAVIKF